MIPPVTIEELREAWPRFLAQTGNVRAREPLHPLALPLSIRCAIMQEYLKGGEPTELMLAVMAQMPIDGRWVKDEMQKALQL